MKHKEHKVSGMGKDMLTEIFHDALPGAGMIVAHEVKSRIPADYLTSMGENAGYYVDAIGVVVGLGAPHLLKGEAKDYARAFGSGVAGQCMYSAYARMQGATGIAGRDNNTYALAKAKNQEALRMKLKQAIAGRDNNSNALAGQRPAGDAYGVFGSRNFGLPGVRVSGGI